MSQSTSPIFFFLSVYTMFKSYLSIPSSKIFLRLLAITTKQWSSMNEHFMRWREFWWMHLRLRQKNLVSKILLEEEPEEEKKTHVFMWFSHFTQWQKFFKRGKKDIHSVSILNITFSGIFVPIHIHVSNHVLSELFDYLKNDQLLFSKWLFFGEV